MSLERNNVVYGFAALLAMVTFWWLQLTTPEFKNEQVIAEHSADYYSLGYQKREMDDFGTVKSEVRAVKMLHYNDDGTVHLERPEIRFFEDKAPPWVIKAERGVLSSSGKELWLNGVVKVSRAAPPGGRAITIITSEVRVLPESSDAETDKWAELSSPPDVTIGEGLQLHYADPIRIRLMNKVRGKYELH